MWNSFQISMLELSPQCVDTPYLFRTHFFDKKKMIQLRTQQNGEENLLSIVSD